MHSAHLTVFFLKLVMRIRGVVCSGDLISCF